LGVIGFTIGCHDPAHQSKDYPTNSGLHCELDEFKGAWRALGTLAPERPSALRRVATIEGIGSSTRIEGSKLSDRELEKLLANLEIKSFHTRDEAGDRTGDLFHALEEAQQQENWSKMGISEDMSRQFPAPIFKGETTELHGCGSAARSLAGRITSYWFIYAYTESLPVMENWTHVVQMAHFSANRCHTFFPQPQPS
jgi:hypothetical protein